MLVAVCVYVCELRFWRQVPGHLHCVESNSLGVVWGVGHDHTAWVYTGGCKGTPAQGTAQGEPAYSSESQG